MPDANDRIKGSGWTRKQAEGWERAFGSKGDLSNFKNLMEEVHCLYHPATCPWGDACADCGTVMPEVDPA